MKNRKRIVIIGGVATGPKVAARARRRDPHADITIIEKGRLLSYAGDDRNFPKEKFSLV